MGTGLLNITASAAHCKSRLAAAHRLLFIWLLLAALLPAIATAAEPASSDVSVVSNQNTIVVTSHGQTLLKYCGAPNPNKPYLQSWKSPAGVELLLDESGEHAHHHGLMFALGVDDTNFWHEDGRKSVIGAPIKPSGDGRQVPRSSSQSASTSGQQLHVVIDQQLDWLAADANPLLLEHRHIQFLSPATDQISILTWQSKLQPAEGRKSASLWGAHYYGVGMRLAKQFDDRGEFRSSDHVPPRTVRSGELLRSGKWCAFTVDDSEHPLTVLFFDHPQNIKPVVWFTMTKPFTYLSATLPLNEEPYTLLAGQPVNLRYGVAVADRKLANSQIEDLFSAWVKSSNHD